ncbi:MAG TPA: sigma-54 dependent transcriptional regulator, partial [Gemmatimonadaceae bacterium]|nr:sigma-54 dependent transcriptional regulator [Gemmatimonadaceae bacterium]
MILARVVENAGHQFIEATNATEALQSLRGDGVDLMICDFQLPGVDGIELVRLVRAGRDRTPIIMLTGHGSIDHAMEAIRAGATDYLVKPFDPQHLIYRVEQCLAHLQLERELDELRTEMTAQRTGRRLLGKSSVLDRALDLVAAAARSRATVLLEGESGTGKELIAREIHELSDRRGRPFIKLNCAALPEGLVESALFGHEKGAFTGAIKRVEGAFERADGGTLLLDEISEMRLDLQAKLLRVLQEREFERVGGSRPISVDVRVIATTNRRLRDEAERGTFRRDLYYRVNVIQIVAPPLRERLSDVPLLAHHFAQRFAAESGKAVAAISAEAIDLLQQYTWPGNVRELQHAVERAVVLSTGPVLDVAAFDSVRRAVGVQHEEVSVAEPTASNASHHAAPELTLRTLNLERAESDIIREALRRTNDNRTHAAALLGIGVRTL